MGSKKVYARARMSRCVSQNRVLSFAKMTNVVEPQFGEFDEVLLQIKAAV
jgi:hypothetical protein